jgi:3-oxoacyl-[acyl-carrier protein] reductase
VNSADTSGQSLEERWHRLMDVDLKGTFWCCHAIGPVMRAQPNGGAIINLAWDHALDGAPGIVSQLYAAAKGGVLALSRCLAHDLAPEVRVNVIAPGWVENDWARSRSEAFRERVAQETPLRRWGQPADIAAAAVFLASPEAAFITGQTLVVDGGIVMR